MTFLINFKFIYIVFGKFEYAEKSNITFEIQIKKEP